MKQTEEDDMRRSQLSSSLAQSADSSVARRTRVLLPMEKALPSLHTSTQTKCMRKLIMVMIHHKLKKFTKCNAHSWVPPPIPEETTASVLEAATIEGNSSAHLA